jgi:hypothetical protein
MDYTLEIKKLIFESEEKYRKLKDELSKLDLESTDILHYLEFHKINAYDGWFFANKLKDIMIKRRKIKDELEPLHSLMNKFVLKNKLEIVEAEKRLNDKDKEIAVRKYTPKVLVNLFKDGLVHYTTK